MAETSPGATWAVVPLKSGAQAKSRLATVLAPWLERRPTAEQACRLLAHEDWRTLAPIAAQLRETGWGTNISYSRKVFVPLTQLCRDVCHYCTFAQTPRKLDNVFLTPEDVLRIAQEGAALGCKEVLFTLGDRPEARYGAAAREALARHSVA